MVARIRESGSGQMRWLALAVLVAWLVPIALPGQSDLPLPPPDQGRSSFPKRRQYDDIMRRGWARAVTGEGAASPGARPVAHVDRQERCERAIDAARRHDKALVTSLQQAAPDWLADECLASPERHWERFYRARTDSFFKDRHVLRTIFAAELMPPGLDPAQRQPPLLPADTLPALYNASRGGPWKPRDFWREFNPGAGHGEGNLWGRGSSSGGRSVLEAILRFSPVLDGDRAPPLPPLRAPRPRWWLTPPTWPARPVPPRRAGQVLRR